MGQKHTAVAIMIIRDQAGNFFVHRRNKAKKLFPGLYGLGAGGRLEPNENPTVAAQRELQEETGLTEPVQHLFDVSYADGTVKHTMHVHEVALNHHNIENHEAEWDWSGWLTQSEVDELANNHKLMPDTIQLYKQYLATKNL